MAAESKGDDQNNNTDENDKKDDQNGEEDRLDDSADPNKVEERVRVDRKKLELLLQGYFTKNLNLKCLFCPHGIKA